MKYLMMVVLFIIFIQSWFINDIPAQQANQANIHKDNLYRQSDKHWDEEYAAIAKKAMHMLVGLREPDKYLGEEGELLGDMLRTLGQSGDIRAKPVFIEAMLCPKISGRMITKGLMNLGYAVLPEIVALLDSTKIEKNVKVILTLSEMAKLDSTEVYFTEDDKKEIVTKLITLSKDSDQKVKWSVALALGHFGNSSVIPVLENMRISDTTQKEKVGYNVKRTAERSIELIQQREVKQNK